VPVLLLVHTYQIQNREHLFKVCPEWGAQQKILWAQVWEVEESVEDPGPLSRWAVQSGDAGLPLCYRCGN